jgi:CheY-like chemotaxis protein
MSSVKELGRAPLCVLHLEDNSWDAELIKWELAKHAIPCIITQLCTEKDFEAALHKGGVDVILSDSQLPGFNTLTALTRSRQVHPTVPFIFVSGTTSLTLKANAFFRGAADFVSKNELPKLASTLTRVLNLDKPKGLISTISPLPEIGIPVMVRCREFRCLGFLDRNGKWRDFVKSLELSDVIDWCDL